MQSRLESFEKYLDKMEALEKYPDVKEQLEKTKKENEVLKAQLTKAKLELLKFEDLRVKFDSRDVSLKEVIDEQRELVKKLHAEEIEKKA